MNRIEFIKVVGLLGIGWPLYSSCGPTKKRIPLNSHDKVIIIGAGAAGLSAAYLLWQKGVEVEILEANTNYGGRMKRTTSFADFPIPTGAEWLHEKRKTLDEIVNNKSINIKTVTKGYNFKTDDAIIDGRKENLKELGFTVDLKFINATWFDFYEDYIVPSIKDQIRLNQLVKSIDYTSDKIVIQTEDQTYEADRVIITVPVKLLQNKAITFTPSLPSEKAEALKKVKVWAGGKAFIEFSEKFYPVATGFNAIPIEQGHKLFYDAAYGQDTQQHILGVFAVGPIAQAYLERDDAELIQYLLAELDEQFDGKASPNYKKHIFQNWATEPFAQGAYVHYLEDWKNIRALGKSVADKLYFAGDAYTDGSSWSSVHTAAQAAKRVVRELVG
ncbi:MAG: FAD-dependent oxidoreductase [Bacteroidota bacterium]